MAKAKTHIITIDRIRDAAARQAAWAEANTTGRRGSPIGGWNLPREQTGPYYRSSIGGNVQVGREIGRSGTEIYQGYILYEPTAALQRYGGHGYTGLSPGQFELIAQSDPDIDMYLSLMSGLISSGTLIVKGGDDRVRDYVEDNLTSWMEPTWEEFTRQVVRGKLMHGFSVDETVFGMRDDDRVPGGRGYFLAHAGYRLQRAVVSGWNVDDKGKLISIRQRPIGGIGNTAWVDIPSRLALVFTRQREGDNYEGRSALRAIWYMATIRQALLRLWGMAHERESLGIPIVHPTTNDKALIKQTLADLEDLRAHSKLAVALPAKWELTWEFAGNQANKRSIADSYERMGQIMRRCWLLQFLGLGENGVGARSLAESMIQVFQAHTGSEIAEFTSVINGVSNRDYTGLVKRMVDPNFGPQKEYPKVDVQVDLGQQQQVLAALIRGGVQSGLIHWTPKLEDALLDQMNLPPLERDENDQIVWPDPPPSYLQPGPKGLLTGNGADVPRGTVQVPSNMPATQAAIARAKAQRNGNGNGNGAHPNTLQLPAASTLDAPGAFGGPPSADTRVNPLTKPQRRVNTPPVTAAGQKIDAPQSRQPMTSIPDVLVNPGDQDRSKPQNPNSMPRKGPTGGAISSSEDAENVALGDETDRDRDLPVSQYGMPYESVSVPPHAARWVQGAFIRAPVEEIPTASLVATRQLVRKGTVDSIGDADTDPINVVIKGNRSLIWDGHNRAVAALVSGKPTLKAKVVRVGNDWNKPRDGVQMAERKRNRFAGWRDLRPEEEHIAWSEIDGATKDGPNRLVGKLDRLIRAVGDASVSAYRKAVTSRDAGQLRKLKLQKTGDLSGTVKSYASDMRSKGYDQVKSERDGQRVDAKEILAARRAGHKAVSMAEGGPDSGDASVTGRAWIEDPDAVIDALAADFSDDVLAGAQSAATRVASTMLVSGKFDEDAFYQALEAAVNGREVTRDAQHVTMVAMNMGREEFAREHGDEIEGVERSELLDDNTCTHCENHDGDTADFGSAEDDEMTLPDPQCQGMAYGNVCRGLKIFLFKSGDEGEADDDEE